MSSGSSTTPSTRAASAAARGAWREAYELLEARRPLARRRGPRSPRRGRLLDGQARRGDRVARARSRRLPRGRATASAPRCSRRHLRATTRLKFDFAVANGWLGKAERLLEGTDESVGAGLCRAHEGDVRDVGRGPRGGARGRRQGRRHRQEASPTANLQAMARVTKGRHWSTSARPTEGLALLDEATAAAVSGELEPSTTGFVYCSRSRRAAGSATIAARPSGRRPRTAGVTGRTSRDSRAPAACTGRRSCACRATGRPPRRRRAPACAELGAFDRVHDGARLLRDRGDPAPPRRLRRRRGGLPEGEGMGPRPAARPGAPPPRAGEDRGGRRRRSSAPSATRTTPLPGSGASRRRWRSGSPRAT